MIKRWFSVGTQIVDASSGGNYLHWFQDAGHTIPVPTSAGMPTTGDTVYWDSNTVADLNGGSSSLNWGGVEVAAGQTIRVYNAQGDSLVFSSASVIGIGSSLITSDGGTGIQCGATWLGDMSITAPAGANLLNGWKVNNGAAGGNITLTTQAGGNSIHIGTPGAGQLSSYGNISVHTQGNSVADVSGLGNISVTGTVSLVSLGTAAAVVTPSGSWLTLNGPSAAFVIQSGGVSSMGVVIGHTPDVSAVLTTGDVFGTAGTVVLPGAGDVRSGTTFGPGSGTTGTLNTAGQARVIGG
jgi:hypothetical protein